MKIAPFKLERYFAKYEFSAPYLMSCSDCEALSMSQVIQMSDPETLAMWENLKLSYTDSKGHPILREEIAKLYTTIGSEEVLVVTPEEGIYIGMQCLIQPGDHMIVTYPAYQSLYEIGKTLGASISKWMPREEEGLFFDVEDLQALIQEDTTCIVINFPHNPTGAMIDLEALHRIVDLARSHDLTIFSDEMYRYLEYDAKDRLPSVADIYPKAVSLCGMSKSFALPGLRIGWLTSRHQELYEQLATYKDYTSICSSGPSELLALMALRNREDIWSRNLAIIEGNLDLFDAFVSRNSSVIAWKRPIAGPIGFPKLTSHVAIDDLCQGLIDKKGVMLLPGSTYDFEGDYFRVGFARENFEEVLEKFEAYLKEIHVIQ